MANEESTNNRFSSNLKVPPLKIVLSSHQNNTVVNISSSSLDTDNQFKSSSNDKDDNSNDHIESEDGEGGRRNGFEDGGEKHHHHKKSSKASSTDRNDSSESAHTSSRTAAFSSSSSSSSSSDRSASTTPSSESESLASNSTIISDQQHQQVNKGKSDNNKEDSSSSNSKHEKVSRYNNVKVSSSEKSGNNSSVANSNKNKSHDNTEQTSETTSTPSSKEQHLNANQRITRSSQRAAQQIKTDNPNSETNGDESTAPLENQEKIHESARKVKRRKGEVQESEQDSAQTTAQLTVAMANIYPADYQLPSQNSFELYRDIRKRPYKKLMKLSHIQPKVPHGFKDYLLNGGPYLLDGNKLGVGLNGSKYESMNCSNGDRKKSTVDPAERVPLRMKLSNRHQKLFHYQPIHQRHTSYTIPKLADAPKCLQVGSPLHELFQDQEKARQKMRMQHLKERERSILAAEQEILRAYNRAAIADVRQKLHLSACTYFYYQERYHYSDEKSGSNGKSGSKEVPHSQDNSFLCIEGGEAPTKANDNSSSSSKDSKSLPTEEANGVVGVDEAKSRLEDDKNSRDVEIGSSSNLKESDQQQLKNENGNSPTAMEFTETPQTAVGDETKGKHGPIKDQQSDAPGTKQPDSNSDNSASDNVQTTNTDPATKSTEANENSGSTKDGERPECDKIDDEQEKKNSDVDSDNSISESPNEKEGLTKNMSDEDLKVFNKEIFINQLQEIDDKWDKIKKNMLVRHKNEADSLHAVQSLEWEWKAKEIGACDVRVSLKIEPEFVPRVEVLALDY